MAPRPNLRRTLTMAVLIALPFTGLVLARNPNEKDIKPQPNEQDRDELFDKDGKPKAGSKLWALDIRVKPLRSIKVNVPGRGEQVCYYLWYQVINKTREPRPFVPDFELVTQDTRMVYRDEILPRVQDAIIAREDPEGILNIKNSITIAKEPIPPSRENADPKAITGVAIWTDPNEPYPSDTDKEKERKAAMPKMIDSNFFSIFIAGLSNGYKEMKIDGGMGDEIITRKSLQLTFHRKGDGALRRDEDIRFTGHKWLYRASNLTIPKEDDKKP